MSNEIPEQVPIRFFSEEIKKKFQEVINKLETDQAFLFFCVEKSLENLNLEITIPGPEFIAELVSVAWEEQSGKRVEIEEELSVYKNGEYSKEFSTKIQRTCSIFFKKDKKEKLEKTSIPDWVIKSARKKALRDFGDEEGNIFD